MCNNNRKQVLHLTDLQWNRCFARVSLGINSATSNLSSPSWQQPSRFANLGFRSWPTDLASSWSNVCRISEHCSIWKQPSYCKERENSHVSNHEKIKSSAMQEWKDSKHFLLVGYNVCKPDCLLVGKLYTMRVSLQLRDWLVTSNS